MNEPTGQSSIVGIIEFKTLNKSFQVQLSTLPKVGDVLRADPMTSKYHLNKEGFWVVASVFYQLSLSSDDEPKSENPSPEVIPRIVLRPASEKQANAAIEGKG